MIKAKVQYRRPKLTIDQKALKKAIRPVVRDTKNKVKGSVPKQTGALKMGVGDKIVSKHGWAIGIIGVRSHYVKKTKLLFKIPNLYAKKMEKIYHFLKRHINSAAVNRLIAATKAVKNELIRKA